MRPIEIVMLAPFPPPVHGASMITQVVRDALHARGGRVRSISTAVGQTSHRRNLRYHFMRFGRNFAALLEVMQHGFGSRRAANLYVVPDGGLGIVYTCVQVLMAVPLFRTIFFHHHTYQYLNRKSIVVSILVKATRSCSTHLFLSHEMAKRFQARYGEVRHSVVPNAHYAVSPAIPPPPMDWSIPFRIGHLSNLCAEKGFFLVAELFENAAVARPDLHLRLAGPVVETAVAERIESLKREFPGRVEYIGPVYGEDKNRFYSEIDAFLFPTLYVKEAQPVVIFEALAAGAPVIANARGCIGEMVFGARGFVVDDPKDYVAKALQILSAWADERPGWHARRLALQQEFGAQQASSRTAFADMLSLLQGIAPSASAGFSLNCE